MRKKLMTVAVLSVLPFFLFAQPIRGPFSLADYITTHSYIGRAGKAPAKAHPSNPAPFERHPQGPASWISPDMGFVSYLLDAGLTTDALVLLGEKNYHPSDTLSYLTGLALLDNRRFEGSLPYFNAAQGAFSDPALFYGTLARLQTGREQEAWSALDAYTGPYRELAALQKGGLALIKGDLSSYEAARQAFTFSDYRLTDSQLAFEEKAAQLRKRRKSPLLAAGMSALLPGSGKIYAGETGPGVAAFLTVAPLAAITAQQWSRYGLRDWRTLVAGSIFSVFYIGNIYGSYMSVSIHEEKIANETRSFVLYHLHVPLNSHFR